MPGYGFLAAPTLYPGQIVSAALQASTDNPHPVACRLFTAFYSPADERLTSYGPQVVFEPGEAGRLAWQLDLPQGASIFRVGLELTSAWPGKGTLYLDCLGWSGPPQATLAYPNWEGVMWRRAWVDGVDRFMTRPWETLRIVQDRGRGLAITGTREWRDYRLSARFTPHLAATCGIAVRVQGLRRYYGLLLYPENTLRLVRVCGKETLLAEAPFSWEFWQSVSLSVQVSGQRLRAWAGERLIFDLVDDEGSLDSGGAGLVLEEGCMACEIVAVQP
jgi:hypothetical protein